MFYHFDFEAAFGSEYINSWLLLHLNTNSVGSGNNLFFLDLEMSDKASFGL